MSEIHEKSIIDLKIFDVEKFIFKCNKKPIITQCTSLLRMCIALKYYQLLVETADGSGDGEAIFIEFIISSYQHCLDDYIHIICHHSDTQSLADIVCDLENNHNFKVCGDMNSCGWSTRHYQYRNRRNNNIHDDDAYNFYLDIFDTIHLYIFHLETLGFRISTNNNVGDGDVDVDDEDYLNCRDCQFGQLQKTLCLLGKHRFH